jgi:hypothetical protein
MGADVVFISYSHDTTKHEQRVLELSVSLRANGVNAELDRYHVRPLRGWPRWCAEMLRPNKSRYVLVICTETYRDRVEGEAKADEGRGAFWEGGIILQYLFDEKGNSRFIPVLLGKEPEGSIPDPLKGHTFYRITSFDRGDEGYEALLRELHGQPIVKRPPLGEPPDFSTSADASSEEPGPRPVREVRTTFTAPADISRIDRYAPKELIGREMETKLIDDAWAKAVAGEPHPRVMTFVALGGEGKTALIAKWAIGQSEKDWPGCEAAFAWTFYSQGSSEQQAASSDLFLAEALKFFGAPTVEGVESAHDKGQRLAKWVRERRALLILDGLEPLQYPPTSPTPGELKDQGLRALLKALVQHNKGLCLVTTRYRIKDIEAYASTAPHIDLARLSKDAGAKLLETLGVKGTLSERETLTEDVKGHALTLNIIGSYLRDAHGGDIRKRDLVKLEEAIEEQGGHAFRAMDAYAEWFESDGEKGARALAMLRLLGLFDRPADAGCLNALWQAPAIDGLTDPLVAMSEAQRNVVLKRLADAKLVSVNRDASGALLSLDAHPLLREYFANVLRENRPEVWKAAHKRLYEHLTTATRDKPEPTLDDLQPLYQAVAHGCLAGMQQEACAKVYRDCILRGTSPGAFYSITKLGAFGADLGAVACFFDPPWLRVSPNLVLSAQAWVLNQAASCLRALGRLTEALEPMRAALELAMQQEDWGNAAQAASNLSELELTLGEVEPAIRDGGAAVAHADRSGNEFQRLSKRTTHADALHRAGRKPESQSLFAEAEAIQAELQPEYPLLYSLQGFRYRDLLLGDAERAAWRRLVRVGGDTLATSLLLEAGRTVSERATQTLSWARTAGASLLSLALDHLTLARTALYRAILRGERPDGEHTGEGMGLLRRAGEHEFILLALLTRALFRAVTRDFGGAREDLDEAFEIAERGPMRLHLADIYLHRARLFGLMASLPANYPWVTPRDDLDKARKLIDDCGYGRRREELEDAEGAWKRIYEPRSV